MGICGGGGAKSQRFCTKEHALCDLRNEPKLFRHLVEDYYMRAPTGKQGRLSAFCQPRITAAQAHSCTTFQTALKATLPQAAMIRIMQGVIEGTLGEEPAEVQTFVRAEECWAQATDQTPCKRVRLTQVEDGDKQEEDPGWPEAEEAIY